MNEYFYLLEYKTEREELERLNEKLRGMQYHSFVLRTSGGVRKYAERYTENGVRHEKILSDEEYFTLNEENRVYNSVRNRMAALNQSIVRMKCTAVKYYETVCGEFLRLKEQAANNNYYKKSGVFMPESRVHRTLRGDYVRSKSEVFIADVLFISGINYIYECGETGAGKHPDFYIPDNIRGVPVIWEHFGMVDSPDYAVKCLKKLDDYRKAGFTVNRNLIITFESYAADGRRIFDSNQAEQVVKEWFLPEGVAV